MPGQRVRDFLDRRGVRYVRLAHSPAYTAQEVAHAAHVRGREFAKTVMVKLDGALAMAVIPATHRLDLDALRRRTGAGRVGFATETEFWGRFPECELGAMPPFGNLYDLPVYEAEELAADEEIAFNAGSHREILRMRHADYLKLVRPEVGRISREAQGGVKAA